MKSVGRLFAVATPVVLALAGSALVAAPVQAEPEPCADVEVVFARGTFEPAGVGGTGQSFVDSLRAKTEGKSVDVYAVNYPASLDFGAAADGVIDASNRVRDVAARCPDTKIVIGGYSQGAAVAAYITEDSIPQGFDLPPGITEPMPASVADHVAAVALFGKPSSGFMQMIYSGAPPINVGSRYTAKTTDLCIPGDPVCSTGGGPGSHNAYVADGLTDQAAAFAADKINAASGPSGRTRQAATG
ncbi:cutinase family protein [Mycolicibacterium sediminis]|uniref:Cutinase n=1 Tax=Mycolicibacterium sediminis TaxID=1286180 RepID=A0A7I7QKE8_9MYCO|nr:cutinase family protein [Mycolicibacterium sediminis]BBY26808.1 putative cutinase Cut1 [Mycolicibacterium sediminis]